MSVNGPGGVNGNQGGGPFGAIGAKASNVDLGRDGAGNGLPNVGEDAMAGAVKGPAALINEVGRGGGPVAQPGGGKLEEKAGNGGPPQRARTDDPTGPGQRPGRRLGQRDRPGPDGNNGNHYGWRNKLGKNKDGGQDQLIQRLRDDPRAQQISKQLRDTFENRQTPRGDQPRDDGRQVTRTRGDDGFDSRDGDDGTRVTFKSTTDGDDRRLTGERREGDRGSGPLRRLDRGDGDDGHGPRPNPPGRDSSHDGRDSNLSRTNDGRDLNLSRATNTLAQTVGQTVSGLARSLGGNSTATRPPDGGINTTRPLDSGNTHFLDGGPTRPFDGGTAPGPQGGLHIVGGGSRTTVLQSATNYLRGLTDGADLPPQTRAVLDAVAHTLGPELSATLGTKETGKVLKVMEHALDHLNRAVEHAAKKGDDYVPLPWQVAPPLERAAGSLGHAAGVLGRAADSPGQPARVLEGFVREMVDELLGAALLNRHLKGLEKTGGNVVQLAEAAIARLLYGPPREGPVRPPVGVPVPADGQHPPTNVPVPTPGQPLPEMPRLHPQEILRDLRTGAFLPPQERYNPFPLTGRARVVAEMMELMRTLDAVEGALRYVAAQQAGGAAQTASAESRVGLWMRALLAGAADGSLDDLLALLLPPTLPGRAGRSEIPRFVAALEGMLTDADGRALLAKDGTQLKLDRLIWLSTAGGLLDTSTLNTSLLGSSFRAENLPSRLSPLLVYGFDAIYTVIGYDGRTLAAPHFVAVQAAVNDSEPEWLFGHQPYTAGWMRELIERLKDSAVVEHNLLGEVLEESLADGRFHVALLSVEVEQGEPVADSSSVTRLLPGAAGELAFA